MRRILSSFSLLVLFLVSPSLAANAQATKSESTYEKDVRPILKAHCFQCHGEDGKFEGGLDVRLRRLMVKGGESGPSIVPGKLEESYLLDRIDSGEMPPGDTKLTKQQVAVISRWVAAGAKTLHPEPEKIDGPFITEEERNFWAFQPIRRPPIPVVKNQKRIRTPIDAFLLAKLETKSLSFSPDADKRTLIRRACFDLIGLPPTPEEVATFLSDNSPNAWEQTIDRLLESPHYGERWGRHWLDVAGYADSEGYTDDDPVRRWSYKYRDYVIQAFNADKPFDQFIQEQLAGDEMVSLPYKNLSLAAAEKLIATGFLRLAPDGTGTSGVDQTAARNQVMADTIQIVSTSLLGLTVGCAQCHDHRYDPIPQTDYYHFRAIFEPAYDWKNWRAPKARLITLYTDADRETSKQIEVEAKKTDAERLKKQKEYIQKTFEKELAKLPKELRETVRTARDTPAKKRTDEQKLLLKKHPSVNVTAGSLYLYDRKAAADLKALAAKASKVRSTKPKEEFIRALTEVPNKVSETFLFYRGDPTQPKQKLIPAGLTILARQDSEQPIPENDSSTPTTGRRLAYARRLTNGTHPLTARVLVNRFWMHHFGRGIVATPGDFGALGARPSHPRLLDWLADEFMSGGWKLKRLHKLMMTSTAYRQQLRHDPKQDEIDPDNLLYGGMRLHRLEAEVIRDSVLAVSGKMNLKSHGAAVPVMADRVGQFVLGIENLNAGRPGAILPMKGEEYRRSIYVQFRRSRPLAVLDTFDLPRMDPNCEIRAASTVAPQSLMLMNNNFIVRQSEHFALRVQQEVGDDRQAQVVRAWKLAFAREPNAEDVSEALAFLAEQTAHFAANNKKNPPQKKSPKKKKAPKNPNQTGQLKPPIQALASFCQILISSNEFLYVD